MLKRFLCLLFGLVCYLNVMASARPIVLNYYPGENILILERGQWYRGKVIDSHHGRVNVRFNYQGRVKNRRVKTNHLAKDCLDIETTAGEPIKVPFKLLDYVLALKNGQWYRAKITYGPKQGAYGVSFEDETSLNATMYKDLNLLAHDCAKRNDPKVIRSLYHFHKVKIDFSKTPKALLEHHYHESDYPQH